jgi:hypothetical protein
MDEVTGSKELGQERGLSKADYCRKGGVGRQVWQQYKSQPSSRNNERYIIALQKRACCGFAIDEKSVRDQNISLA